MRKFYENHLLNTSNIIKNNIGRKICMRTIIVVVFFICCSNLYAQELKGDLTVKLKGFKNVKGTILIDLFKNETGFPNDRTLALVSVVKSVTAGEIVVVLKNIPFASYALSAVHDENKNNKLDKNFMGIPKEGWSASNYKKAPFGSPDFNTAEFLFKTDGQILELIMFN